MSDRKEGCASCQHRQAEDRYPDPEAAGAADPNQAVARDRRVDRTEDLNEEEIAPVEASQMEARFRYLDAELEPAGASVVEVGVDFAENFGRAAMPPRDGRLTRRFATACSTIPDRDPTPARPAGAKIDRKGRGLFLPEEGRGWHGSAFSSISARPRRFWAGFRGPEITDLRIYVQPYR